MTENSSWVNRVAGADAGRLGALAVSRTTAEVSSTGVSLGAAYFLDHVCELKPIKQGLAKIIEPLLLEPLDYVANNLGGLETRSERKERQAMSASDRAYLYSDVLFDYSARLALSAKAQSVTQQAIDNQLLSNQPTPDKQVYDRLSFMDNAVQLGAFVALNTLFSEQNHAMQDAMKPVIQKTFNLDDKDAKKWSRDLVNVQLPNILSMGLSIGLMEQEYRKL